MPNKSNIFFAFTVILIFTCLVCFLSSCEREDDASGNGDVILVPPSGDPVTINFTIGERDYNINDVTVRNAQALSISPPSEGLGEVSSLYMSASLIENVAPVRLRSSQLEEDTKVRIAAYDRLSVPNDTILLAFADYTIETGALVPHGTPPMTVPSGSILFVAYSFNDTITMDAFNETIVDIGSCDLLWGDTTETVGPGNTNVKIILDHLFAKIEVQAETILNPTSVIDTIFGARYDHAFPALTIKSGDLAPNALLDTIHVDWQSTVIATTWTSEEHFVYTPGIPPVVTIDSMTIDGTLYNSGPYTANYATALIPGKEYTLYLRFMNSSSGLTVTPDEVNLSYLAHTPASESLSVTASGSWTLSIPNLGANQWLWLSLYPNGSSPQLSVSGAAGTTTVYLVATANMSDTNRDTEVYLNGVVSDVVSTIYQEGQGGSADRITVEGVGANAKLVITRNERDAGLYFKFGGVVGLYSRANGTQDLAMQRLNVHNINSTINNYIAFKPGSFAITQYGGTSTNVGDVPGWHADIYPGLGSVSDDIYHNLVNVKDGRGDPCRLIGMTVAQINAMSADADLYGLELSLKQSGEGGWRMPTNAENQAITQQLLNYVTGSIFWTTIPAVGTTLGDVPGVIFPDNVNGLLRTFMPAAGFVAGTGNINSQGLAGYYWLSQPVPPATSGYIAYHMNFGPTTMYVNTSVTGSEGYTVRCIRNENNPVIPPQPVVSPSSITLSGSAYTPALAPDQVVNVAATGSWILTSNMPWMRLTLNADGSGAGMSVTGTGNQTVYLMVDGNPSLSSGRAANILLGSTVKVTVVQGAYEPGGYAERITWEEPDATYPAGRYVITGNYTDAGLHFRFGSVVGIFSGAGSANQTLPGTNTSVFNASIHIAWSPVTTITGTGSIGWATIPYVPASAHPVTFDATFHTLNNVRAGLGDPCRLVGLDLSAIANLSNPNPVIDNGEWMLPTPTQNGDFTFGTVGSGGAHWWGNGMLSTIPSVFDSVPGAEFPIRNSNGGTPNPAKFLPANGLRGYSGNGEAGYFGDFGVTNIQGRYWGNATILNPTTSEPEGAALGFNQGSASTAYGSYPVNQAFGVRCVRQP